MRKDKSVVLITIDGVRIQDLLKLDQYINKSIINKGKIWPSYRNAAPLLSSENNSHFIMKPIKVLNKAKISYPGYSEILTGKINPNLLSNEYGPNPVKTFLEEKKNKGGDILVSAKWDAFKDIYNSKRSGIQPLIAIRTHSKNNKKSKNELQEWFYERVKDYAPEFDVSFVKNPKWDRSELHDVEVYYILFY